MRIGAFLLALLLAAPTALAADAEVPARRRLVLVRAEAGAVGALAGAEVRRA